MGENEGITAEDLGLAEDPLGADDLGLAEDGPLTAEDFGLA